MPASASAAVTAPKLAAEGLSKRYGPVTALEPTDLSVAAGEFLTLLGPSGSGKTTVLQMICGLIQPTTGRILIDGRDETETPVHRRDVGLVFQHYALFPHLTVAENVEFPLRMRRRGAAAIRKRVADALAMVQLEHLGGRFPRELSGGQQQRVALARAIAPRPRVLLLDEPLSNLDAALRDEMQIELKRLQRELGITTVFVTHDQSEALTLSDRICILANGRVQQLAGPEEIYRFPANAFVAGFLGKANRLAGTIVTRTAKGGTLRLPGGILIDAHTVEGSPGEAAEIFIRPEGIHPVNGSREGARAELVLRAFAGAQVQLVYRLGSEVELIAVAPRSAAPAQDRDGAIHTLHIDPESVFAFPSGQDGRP